jgi:PmbA protein
MTGLWMDEDQMVDLVKGAFDAWELLFLKERSKKFETRQREIFGVEVKEDLGVALRGLKKGKMVFSFTRSLDETGIADFLKTACSLVEFVDAEEYAAFPSGEPAYPVAPPADVKGLGTADDTKVAAVAAMEAAILDYDPRIVTTRNCELAETFFEERIVNSAGLDVSAGKTLYTAFALAVAKEEDEVSYDDWAWSHSFDGLDMGKVAASVAQGAISSLGGRRIETGVYRAVLTPRAACDILEVLSGSFLAESLHKGKTRLAGRIGERCFAPIVTIIDSGLKGADAFPFDAEGVASRDTRLVVEGTFKGFLYDRYYGLKLGHPSTGNAVRGGLGEAPKCGIRGLFIEAGRGDVLSAFDAGVIIEGLMGLHTANTVTGDFSLGAVGRLRKGGAEVPFNGVIISGNIFDLMESVKAVGEDLVFYGSFGSPSLLVEGMKISGT